MRIPYSSVLLLVPAAAFAPFQCIVPNLPPLRALPHASEGRDANPPKAIVEGYVSPTELPDVTAALQRAGFDTSPIRSNDNQPLQNAHRYSFVKATGMLKLLDAPGGEGIPTWIPIISDMEHVLVKNGWSFLDPDSSESVSAFDIDAANREGQYIPKWGQDQQQQNDEKFSDSGFSVRPLTKDQIQIEATELRDDLTRRVLLEGATDPPNRKITHNGVAFSGSKDKWPKDEGIFVCAIGGLPLFTSHDLVPTTASSGWLSFSRPVSSQHIELVKPDSSSVDQRVEVVCARSKCHLGHYFGPGEGYCINASALNFFSANSPDLYTAKKASFLPSSFRYLEILNAKNPSPSSKLLHQIASDLAHSNAQTVILGAGCFWHVEFALRRLPGVIATECGYCGGTIPRPSYEEVCQGQTGHAEVVKVTFLPHILRPRILFECFLAMHDPTKTRAHGKHALGTGQYRSCIFVKDREMFEVARRVLEECESQLGRGLSTELGAISAEKGCFWSGEERHQRHNERRMFGDHSPSTSEVLESCGTLDTKRWLLEYGKRSKSVLGSSESLNLHVG
jgi:methionine-S-sulfoxide reductase